MRELMVDKPLTRTRRVEPGRSSPLGATWHGRPYSLLLTLPPLGTIVLEPAR